MLGQQESVEEARAAVIVQHLDLLAILEPMELEKLDQHAEKSWQLLAVLLVVKRSFHRQCLPSTIRLECLAAQYHQRLS